MEARSSVRRKERKARNRLGERASVGVSSPAELSECRAEDVGVERRRGEERGF